LKKVWKSEGALFFGKSAPRLVRYRLESDVGVTYGDGLNRAVGQIVVGEAFVGHVGAAQTEEDELVGAARIGNGALGSGQVREAGEVGEANACGVARDKGFPDGVAPEGIDKHGPEVFGFDGGVD